MWKFSKDHAIVQYTIVIHSLISQFKSCFFIENVAKECTTPKHFAFNCYLSSLTYLYSVLYWQQVPARRQTSSSNHVLSIFFTEKRHFSFNIITNTKLAPNSCVFPSDYFNFNVSYQKLLKSSVALLVIIIDAVMAELH